MIWPLPIEKIRKLSKEYANIIVLEEMLPFMEEELKINGIPAKTVEVNFSAFKAGRQA